MEDPNKEKHELPPPEHMDRYSCNKRLYDTLFNMGLFVDPIYEDGDPNRILKMEVAARPPQGI